jgi:hypothetical protein
MGEQTTILNGGNVTPSYLLSHGFVQYKSADEVGIHEIPFYSTDDLYFVESNFDRRMFVVSFSPSYNDDDHWHHSIYVQEDAGCGFVCIPEAWWDLPVEYFEAIYYGIRGEKPKFTKTVFTCDEFEVLTQQQLPESKK